MKIAYNWLKEFIPLEMKAEEVADILTGTGLEVEKIHEYIPLKADLEGVVVGKVLEVRKHPNADKLFLTKVDLGEGEPVQIVCGAPNVAEGQKVPVATIGTRLIMPDGSELKIKKGKIRGEYSYGMICAEDELGLSDNHDGIMVLDPEVPVGQKFTDVLGIEKDYVFEIGLTPNRADAMSHFGVARDLYAKLSFEKQPVTLKTRSTSHFVPEVKKQPVSVTIDEKNKCPRYAGLVIQNVKPVESPAWLQHRLRSIGINPKNLLVDITNFVMHDIGQPMHAFDLSAIKGNKIIVRNARPGEKILALDDKEYELTPDDLVIANEYEPMAIAGVMGGKYSAIHEGTTDIFLESAYFDPVTVRKTSKRLGLTTDSSFRFERGVDPTQTDYALKWAAILIKEHLPEAVITEIVDETAKTVEPRSISLTYAYIWQLIGEKIHPDEIKRILHLLDFKIILSNKENLTVEAPLYRVDVTRPADVVEEILRIYGYDNVKIPEKMHFSVAPEDPLSDDRIERTIAALLTDSGLSETMSVSMQPAAWAQEEGTVRLLNPVSAEHEIMRRSMLMSFLENLRDNVNRQHDDLAFFEFGKIYFKTGEAYNEQKVLSMGLTGDFIPENWVDDNRFGGFFYFKGLAEKLMRRLGIAYAERATERPDFQDAVEFRVEGNVIGVAGIVRKDLAKKFDLKKPVYYAEWDWEKLVDTVKKSKGTKIKPFSKFPAVRRDLALLVDKEVTYAELYRTARETEKKLLEEVRLFDVYEGDKIPPGKKSYALSFLLRSPEKTLRDRQVDQIMSKILHALEKKTGAKLREQ